MTPLSPLQASKRVGSPDITSFHRPLRSLSGKKGGSRPIPGLAARRLSAHKGLQAPPGRCQLLRGRRGKIVTGA